jgi:hypothetical protein
VKRAQLAVYDLPLYLRGGKGRKSDKRVKNVSRCLQQSARCGKLYAFLLAALLQTGAKSPYQAYRGASAFYMHEMASAVDRSSGTP